MKKKNKKIIVILILLFVSFGSFFLRKYVSSELKEYNLYNDYTRANQVMLLSFNKNFYHQYPLIRYIQSSTENEKVTEGSLIYDFAKHDMIPILNYLNSEIVNLELINSFSLFFDFLANYNAATHETREDILVRLSEKDYYIYNKNVYTYKVEKEVIKKEFFHEIYDKYLKSNNEKNVQNNLINKLYRKSEIKESYSYDKLVRNIKNNYNEFYKKNENIILLIIAEDLREFSNYLSDYVLIINDDELPTVKLDIKDIKTEKIEISYNFIELDRIYSSISKYYTHSYQLDIENVWQQMIDLGYPKLYN